MRIVLTMARQLGGHVEIERDGSWKAIVVEFPSDATAAPGRDAVPASETTPA
jgi:hypothetical protein